MGADTLLCNLRLYPEQDGRAIVPDLVGPDAALDKGNEVASVVGVSVLLAAGVNRHNRTKSTKTAGWTAAHQHKPNLANLKYNR